jgi:hypothetical protein
MIIALKELRIKETYLNVIKAKYDNLYPTLFLMGTN